MGSMLFELYFIVYGSLIHCFQYIFGRNICS